MRNNWHSSLQTLITIGSWALGLGTFYFFFNFVVPLTSSIAHQVASYLLPFILGAMMAFFIEPMVTFLVKKFRMNRNIATFAALIAFIGSFSVSLVLIISKLIVEMIRISATLPSPQKIAELFYNWVELARGFYVSINPPPEILDTVQRGLSEMLLTAKNFMVSGSNFLLDTLASLPAFITILLFGLISSYFFARDKRVVLDTIYHFFPAQRASQVRLVLAELGSAFSGFITAQTILISITGLLTIIGLYLIGVEYAFTIGIITGLLDLVPIVGPGLVFVPWLLWCLFTGNYAFALKLGLLYGFLSLTRSSIEPKVVADSLGLHPLATLIALYVGLKAFGALGVLIGPSILLVLVAMHRAGIFNQGGGYSR